MALRDAFIRGMNLTKPIIRWKPVGSDEVRPSHRSRTKDERKALRWKRNRLKSGEPREGLFVAQL